MVTEIATKPPLQANSSFNIMTDTTCFSRVTVNVVPRHSIIDQAASETGDLSSSKLCEPKLDYENCTSKLFEENVEFMEKSTTPSKNVPFIRTTKRRPIQHGKVVKRTTVRSSDKASEANSNKTLACQINSTQKKNKKDNKLQKQLSDFFPVRKSTRKPQTVLLEEKQKELVDKILNHCHDGLEIKHFSGKGRGIITTKIFIKGEFVVEYEGELIDSQTAKYREANYSKDKNAGCYMYYFKHNNQKYCIDSTPETGKIGRLINHSRNGNLVTKVIEVMSVPHLIFVAKEDIATGSELSYDYGDRDKETIKCHPWLAM
ncbi:histone-lysine N-methyltransferase pr-set7-like [Trichogramma pretiosum]|uniref:histone-lysine N-methyltransferase pr-set7-like n=1 Tax=Trichogramma pretiosum TaxID=7493 RepID=UPI0006C980BD|nr:histone-lysine N-methyltransferase pr-set7-like [Trichogramma pretiosum]